MIGVNKIGKKYRASILVNVKRIHLGMFDTEVEAAKVYDEAAIEYHGNRVKTNFGRRLTVHEEQVFRLVSGDHYNLSIRNAALAMGWCKGSIVKAIKRIHKKCPSLFPLKMKRPKVILRYEKWMDGVVKMKF